MFGSSTKVGGVHLDITARDGDFRTKMAAADAQARRTGASMQAAMNKAEASTRRAGAAVDGMGGALGKLAAAGSLVIMASQAIKLGDAFSLMRSRLRLVVTESEGLLNVEEKLAQQAISNRADLTATVSLYTKLRQVRRDLSDEAARDIVDKWSKTLIISGASASEAAAATMQFGQAMASGRLAGDELRSILENNSRFALVLSEGLGVTIGQLRQLGEEGKLTTDAIMEAFKRAGGSLESDFGKKAMTVGQAMTNVSTAMTRLVGLLDQATGTTAALAKWTSQLADALGAAGNMVGAATKEAQKYGKGAHDLASALDQFVKAQIAANTATGEGNDKAREAAANTRAQVVEQLRLNEALLKEAEARLTMLRVETEATARFGGDGSGAVLAQRGRAQKNVDELQASISAARNTLANEQNAAAMQKQVADLLRKGADAIGLEITPPSQKGGPGGVTPEAIQQVQELSGYLSDLESLERSLSDIRQASAEGATNGSRAALSAVLDYADATDDLNSALLLAQRLAGDLLNPSDARLLSDLLAQRADPINAPTADLEALKTIDPALQRTMDNQAMWQRFGQNVQDAAKWGFLAAVESGDWGEALADVLRSTLRDALSNALDNVFNQLGEIDWGGFGKGWGGIASAAFSSFGGSRAGGGDVMAGRAYRVGELGSETFIPKVDGFIIPNNTRQAVDPRGLGASASVVVGGASITVQGNLDGVTLTQLESALSAHRRALPGAVQQVITDRRIREGW